METYGKILLVAMPVFLLLVLLEKGYGWYRGKDTVRQMDMISSLSSGVTNVTKDVLGLGVVVLSYSWLVGQVALVHPGNGIWVYIAAFLALDFSGYWVHRIEHRFNFFWNYHIIHHSSEEFNLACALRQSISEWVKIFAIFLLPAALLGVPAGVIAIVAPIQLFAQFWYHTRHIKKMGWLEKWIVTPSHHRVHHAINPEYIDRNFSQIFIIWDKLFGTFQEELPEVPPVYGITRPVRTWNPVKINFMHLWLLFQDAWRTRNYMDKIRIWMMPTGWRPADVAQKYPVNKISSVYTFEKYDPAYSGRLLTWTWVQLLMLLGVTSYLFGNIAAIGSPGIFWFGLYIFISVYAFTELMDLSRWALAWELLKNALGVYLLILMKQWVPSSMLNSSWAGYLAGAWFALSTLIVGWFSLVEFSRSGPLQPSSSPQS